MYSFSTNQLLSLEKLLLALNDIDDWNDIHVETTDCVKPIDPNPKMFCLYWYRKKYQMINSDKSECVNKGVTCVIILPVT